MQDQLTTTNLEKALGEIDSAEAVVGTLDIAMRPYLPSEVMAFTVTKAMFEQLCSLDEHSFLYKSFWQRLKVARETSAEAELGVK